MKKILFYLIGLVLICFILPSLLTKRTKEVNTSGVSKNETKEISYDYKKYANINLLHKDTGEVEKINIDEYLYNVVSAEMPAAYELEALKAQAIVARTYTIYTAINKKHDNADICDDSGCCQAWISKEDRFNKWNEEERENNWNKICKAVNETKGKIITYNNIPINAFFHSNSGGITEIPVNVWGGTGYPYLQSVETSGEEEYRQYASEVILSQEDLLNKLKEKYQDISIDFNNDEQIKIIEYTESKRVKTVRFGNYDISGVEARKIFGLKSTNFEIIKENNNGDNENIGYIIKFQVKGYGHGVGMSQTGADSMAKQGKSAEEIIKHFYTDVEITEVNVL